MTPWDQLVGLSRVTCPEGGWRPDAISSAIDAALGARDIARRTRLGESFEGRPITLFELGSGPRRVLLWSQMHGNEPTHTTALINLLGLLARGDAGAKTLLGGLTLGVITPLNPDGSERCIRHNAQGIDVNRDALAFATPEGRALRDAIAQFKPEYGFNLHNQGYRTTVGSPPEPVAVSLLVPPVDPQDTQTESTLKAARVAAFLCEAAAPHCGGRISRYEIDYMARAFGEWVQRQGVAALLVEASGWPGGSFQEPERLHFAALVQTLEALAQGGLGDDSALEGVDPQRYLDLPRSSGRDVFDLLLAPAGVAQSASGKLTRAEIGIDFPERNAAKRERERGVIRALGDLHESEGLDRIDAPDCVVLPGRIALAQPIEALEGVTAFDTESPLRHGVTTVLLPIDLSSAGLEERLEAVLGTPLAANAALVGVLDAEPSDLPRRMIAASAAGMVAVLSEKPGESAAGLCEALALPVLAPADLPVAGAMPATVESWIEETTATARLLGWNDRGRVGLGAPADLVLSRADGALAQDRLRLVCVGGTVAWGEGAPRGGAARWIA